MVVKNVVQKFWSKKKFLVKKLFVQKYLVKKLMVINFFWKNIWPKRFQVKKFVGSKNLWGQKNCLVEKDFVAKRIQKNFGSESFCGRFNFVWDTKNWMAKKFWMKKFLGEKNVGVKKILAKKIIMDFFHNLWHFLFGLLPLGTLWKFWPSTLILKISKVKVGSSLTFFLRVIY